MAAASRKKRLKNKKLSIEIYDLQFFDLGMKIVKLNLVKPVKSVHYWKIYEYSMIGLELQSPDS